MAMIDCTWFARLKQVVELAGRNASYGGALFQATTITRISATKEGQRRAPVMTHCREIVIASYFRPKVVAVRHLYACQAPGHLYIYI